MKHGFYSRIALENIQKNRRLYIPRILAEAGLLGCFYILLTLAMDSRMADALGGAYLSMFMTMGAVIIGLLSFILILYVNSFLMKRRKSSKISSQMTIKYWKRTGKNLRTKKLL